MAYIPGAQAIIRDKNFVQWSSDGENGDELVLNRPINDVADMVLTLRDDSIVSDPATKGDTVQTVYKEFHFNGRVYFDGGSTAGDDAIAMAIALG
jgi:hypothetical protein